AERRPVGAQAHRERKCRRAPHEQTGPLAAALRRREKKDAAHAPTLHCRAPGARMYYICNIIYYRGAAASPCEVRASPDLSPHHHATRRTRIERRGYPRSATSGLTNFRNG